MSVTLRTLVVELRRLGTGFRFPLTEGKAFPVGAARRWGKRCVKKTPTGWVTAPARSDSDKRDSAATIITRDDGRVLMLQRGDREPWMPGKWNLPGGGLGREERPLAAAKRETREEAGVKIRKLRKVGKFSLGDGTSLHVYHAHGYEGAPVINFESKKLKWVHHSKAHRMDVLSRLRPILKHFSRESRRR